MERDFGGGPGQTGSGSRGGETTQQVKQQGQQLTRQVRQQASDLASRGGEQVKSQLDNQKHEVVQRMTPVQTALRETAHQLRKQGQGPTAQYVDRTGDQIDRFSGYLRETDVDDIIDEVRGVARRRPALFLSGAAALGFLATRFLKSSSQEGANGGDVSDTTTPNATSRAAVIHRDEEPTTALPPGYTEREPLTTGRPPAAGQPLGERDRTEPPRGF